MENLILPSSNSNNNTKEINHKNSNTNHSHNGNKDNLKILPSLGSNEEEDPLELLASNLDKFIYEAKSNINKCKFRKVLEEIRDKEGKYANCTEKWQLHELKLKCMCKVINRKYIKTTNPKNIDSWLLRIDLVLENWFEDITSFEQKYKNSVLVNIQLEIYIKYLLEQCLNYANFSKNEKQISDCIGFLGLGERLIKYVLDSTNYPDTLNVIQRIYLFISAILIADLDFETAKLYQSSSLKVGLRELYLRVEDEEGININKLSKSEVYNVKKCIINIVIAFYQRGVCEESLGNILRAIESYKQAKWFALNFLKDSNPEFTMFIEDVETRAINYNKLIMTIKSINTDHLKLNNKKNSVESKLYFNEEIRFAKYDHLKEKINKINFEEIEDTNILVKKSEKVKFILSTVKLVNNLMSEKFREIVINSDDLKINKIPRELKDKIQKRINGVKAEELYNEKEKNKEEKGKPNQTVGVNRPSPIKEQLNNDITESYFSQTIKKEKNNDESNFISKKQNENINQNDYEGIILNNEVFLDEFDKMRAIEPEDESKRITRPETSKDNFKSCLDLENKNLIKKKIQELGKNSILKDRYEVSNQKIIYPVLNTVDTNSNNNLNSQRFVSNSNYNLKQDTLDIRPETGRSFNKTSKDFKEKIKLKHSSEDVKQFKFSNYIGNQTYHKKLNYLESVELKEANFQKDLLNLKKQEKFVVENFDPKKIDENCQNFFGKILVNSKKTFIEDDKAHKKKEILLEEKNKYELKKAELTNKVLRSLDVKKLVTLNGFIKKNEKPNLKIRENFKTSVDDKFEYTSDRISKLNKDRENLLNIEIKKMECFENRKKREIWPNTYKSKKKRSIGKLNSSQNENQNPTSNFIKIAKND